MKKILLLSDTHGCIDTQILGHAAAADEVWHAGDIGDLTVTDALAEKTTLKAVFGNIDGAKIRVSFNENLFFKCEEVPVLMTHIGGSPKRYAKGVRTLVEVHKPKLFICGHSHILKVQYDHAHQLLYMNPGAVGRSGFHNLRTMLRFEIDGPEIKNLEVIELGPRSKGIVNT